MKKSIILLLILVNYSTQLFALASCNEKNKTCTGLIDELIVNKNTDIYFNTIPKPEDTSLNKCIDKRITLKQNHPMHKDIYSMLLSAKLANHAVTFTWTYQVPDPIFTVCEVDLLMLSHHDELIPK